MLVDSSLPGKQTWVQACHAVSQFQIEKPNQWKNEAIVVLTVPDLEPYKTRDCVLYREPDFDLRVTALATGDPTGLGALPLL